MVLPSQQNKPLLRDVTNTRPSVPVFSRQQFLEKFAEEYKPGQHVTFIGPTQRGKTTLCHQMLNAVVSHTGIRVVIFAGKPPSRDPVMGVVARRLNLRILKEWPPGPYQKTRSAMQESNGYVLRPEHDMDDPDKTDKIHHNHFKAALTDNYKSKKPVIVVVDEGVHIANELRLKKHMDTILMRGAPVVALWTLVQRGRYMSYMIYDQVEWFILAYDPDTSNQKRYSDIGGVDPKLVFQIQQNLETREVETGGTISQFLCVRRSGPQLLIIDMD